MKMHGDEFLGDKTKPVRLCRLRVQTGLALPVVHDFLSGSGQEDENLTYPLGLDGSTEAQIALQPSGKKKKKRKKDIYV